MPRLDYSLCCLFDGERKTSFAHVSFLLGNLDTIFWIQQMCGDFLLYCCVDDNLQLDECNLLIFEELLRVSSVLSFYSSPLPIMTVIFIQPKLRTSSAGLNVHNQQAPRLSATPCLGHSFILVSFAWASSFEVGLLMFLACGLLHHSRFCV